MKSNWNNNQRRAISNYNLAKSNENELIRKIWFNSVFICASFIIFVYQTSNHRSSWPISFSLAQALALCFIVTFFVGCLLGKQRSNWKRDWRLKPYRFLERTYSDEYIGVGVKERQNNRGWPKLMMTENDWRKSKILRQRQLSEGDSAVWNFYTIHLVTFSSQKPTTITIQTINKLERKGWEDGFLMENNHASRAIIVHSSQCVIQSFIQFRQRQTPSVFVGFQFHAQSI